MVFIHVLMLLIICLLIFLYFFQTGSHKLFVHDSLTSSSFHSPSIADLDPTIKCLYNTESGTFLTASGSTIKIWNSSTGMLERVYRNIIDQDISACCLDDSNKKFIIADVNGSIYVFNCLNGCLMKSVHNPSAREITCVSYIPILKNLIATAWDGAIYLYDETCDENIPLIKRMKQHKGEITCSAYSMQLTLFASGASDGYIYLWDYRAHALIGELLGHRAELTAICFLEHYPILVSGDNEGNICFWVVRPIIVNTGKCILRLLNGTKGKNATKNEVCPVTALVFKQTDEGGLLYAGDVNGNNNLQQFI
jgi:WD40 repeat protein